MARTLALAVCSAGTIFGQAQGQLRDYHVATHEVIRLLLENEDTDGDRKITVHDPYMQGTDRGDKVLWFTSVDGVRCEIAGTYYLSNLLQELTLLGEAGHDTGWVRGERIFEPPAARISRTIRDNLWKGLTRTVDEAGLLRLVADEKIVQADGYRYVYVPATDTIAQRYFAALSVRHAEWRMRVRSVPEHPDSAFLHGLVDKHGLLTLGLRSGKNGNISGVPFLVPGGRFNEMYGWDSYFIILGLLRDDHVTLARDMVDNLAYEVRHYGAILNANRTYYLTRSQPPFLTSAALACYERLPGGLARRTWLQGILGAAIAEYEHHWNDEHHRLPIGLNRYYDAGAGLPPEVEPGHYDVILQPFARQLGLSLHELSTRYGQRTISIPELDTFFTHDRAMRESGHDTSYRLLHACADLATVDLNALLYKMEMDIASSIRDIFGDALLRPDGRVEKSAVWFQRAETRKRAVDRYLWNADRGMYFDYNVVTGSQTGYVSATTFWPLWAGLASTAQAEMVVNNALPVLELPGGIAATGEGSRGNITPDHPQRQWDFPFGWAPHQMLAWEGLAHYGYRAQMERLVYKWLFTITMNAAHFNGTIPEKFDVLDRTHEVFAEYGNVGTRFDYIAREGFGWTNASYQVGLGLLSPGLYDMLNRLIPPESAPLLRDAPPLRP